MPALCDKNSMVLDSKASSGWRFGGVMVTLVYAVKPEYSSFLGSGGVVAACSAYNQKVVGSNPGSALLIPEVNAVDIQLRALLGLRSLLVHSAKCAGNRM